MASFFIIALLLAILAAGIGALYLLAPGLFAGNFGKWKPDMSSHTLSAKGGFDRATYVHNAPKSAEQMHDDKRQYLKERQKK